MTKQADMVKAENIHIIELTRDLVDRLTAIKFKPESIFCEGVEENLIVKLYPTVYFGGDKKVDLILAAIKFSLDVNLADIMTNWKKRIKPEGMILFAFIEFELDIRELGDVLMAQGFRDLVLDYENNDIFGHALGPKEVRINVNQIRRVN